MENIDIENNSSENEKGNKKIIIGIGILVVLAAVSWFGYKALSKGESSNTTNNNLYKEKITIGYTLWPGYLGLYLAQDKGYFKEVGLDVDVKGYTSLSEQYADYMGGKTQGSAMITLDVINQSYSGLDHKILLAIDHSNGSDGIIASPNIKTIAELKGKKVGFEYGTLEEFFLRYALDRNNVNFKDIVPVNLDPEKSAEAFTKGEVDVAVTYEPFMSKALSQKPGKKIYSSADAPGLITDVLAFHSDFISAHPDTVEEIIRAYFKAIKFWKDNPKEANIIIAKYLDTTVDQASAQVQGVAILNEEDNRIAFTFAPGLQSLYGNTRTIGDFISELRKKDATTTDNTIDTDSLIDPRFIQRILR